MFDIIMELYNKLIDKILEKIKKTNEQLKKHKKSVTRALIALLVITIIGGISYIIKNTSNIIRIDNSQQGDNIIVKDPNKKNKDKNEYANNTETGSTSKNGDNNADSQDGNDNYLNNDNNNPSGNDNNTNAPDRIKDNSKYINPDNISDDELNKLIKENEKELHDTNNTDKNNNNDYPKNKDTGKDNNDGNKNGDSAKDNNEYPIPPEEKDAKDNDNAINNGPAPSDGNDYVDEPTVTHDTKVSGLDKKLTNTYYNLITNKEPVPEHVPKDNIDKMLDDSFAQNQSNDEIQKKLLNYTEKGEKVFSVADVKTAELGVYPSLTKMYNTIKGVQGNYDYIYLKLYYDKDTHNYSLKYANTTVNNTFK